MCTSTNAAANRFLDQQFMFDARLPLQKPSASILTLLGFWCWKNHNRTTKPRGSEDYFSFSPQTWVLPEEMNELRAVLWQEIWLVLLVGPKRIDGEFFCMLNCWVASIFDKQKNGWLMNIPTCILLALIGMMINVYYLPPPPCHQNQPRSDGSQSLDLPIYPLHTQEAVTVASLKALDEEIVQTSNS